MKNATFMRTFRWPSHKVTLSLYEIPSIGRQAIGYRMFWQGRLIFEGRDFHNSPLHAIDSADTAKSLMSFLCLKEGDVESEYFDNYTSTQLEWRDSDTCEQMSRDIGG